MPLIKLFKRIYSKVKGKNDPLEKTFDVARIALPGLDMTMLRKAKDEIPSEFSLYVPRAEIRKSVEEAGKKTTCEVLLNSVTIVHAPRHKSQGEPPPETSEPQSKFK